MTLSVTSGGTESGSTVFDGGVENVESSGTASGTVVSSGGHFTVSGGGKARGTIVDGGNALGRGGSIKGALVENGGVLRVSSGGSVSVLKRRADRLGHDFRRRERNPWFRRAVMLHADFARKIWAEQGCAPLAEGGAEVEAARSWLLERAEALGWERTVEPEPRLLVDGVERPVERLAGGRLRLTLPTGSRRAVLASRSAVPAELLDAGGERRRLGVALARVALNGAELLLNDDRLGAGWHGAEEEWRWSDGADSDAIQRGS